MSAAKKTEGARMLDARFAFKHLIAQHSKRGISIGDIVQLADNRIAEVVAFDQTKMQVKLQPLNVARSDLDKAARSARAFNEISPTVSKHAKPKLEGVGWSLGKMVGVMYEADTKEGLVTYFHRFKIKARPTLAVFNNGKTLVTLSGAFRVGERGIVDDK